MSGFNAQLCKIFILFLYTFVYVCFVNLLIYFAENIPEFYNLLKIFIYLLYTLFIYC